MPSKVYFSFALNSSFKLVNINDAIKGQDYYCPSCGAPMITKMGNVKRWHFAHKEGVHNCSDETYLHKLAKIRISECFNRADNFWISFYSQSTCAINDCPLASSSRCKWMAKRKFDLKKYYNICKEEVIIDDFIADLLVSNTESINLPPILIEIFVTHKSSQKKLMSGNRIIEIHVRSEEDIEQIVASKAIIESDGIVDKWNLKPNEQIRFYNFKADIIEVPAYEYQQPRFRFWIDSKGFFQHKNLEDQDESERCLTPNSLEIENSRFRIESRFPIGWDFAFYNLAKSGLGIKYCTMCKFYRMNDYYGKSMCILYKSKGTKQYPILSTAMRCSHFRQIDYIHDERLLDINFNQECKITIR